jgi:alginate O-acetyltransferase complex protein AlgI
MAIGLGKMFGFKFLENFNYPYFSRSIREFWKRWHISLSSWFRDYLYIPLGGNRRGKERMYSNLLLVFFLCGLWHGANWTFIVWGLLHGLFIIFEHGKFGRWLALQHVFIRHFYVILFLCNTWVFFRIDSISHAVNYLEAMYAFGSSCKFYPLIALQLDFHFFCVFIVGLVLSMPVFPMILQYLHHLKDQLPGTDDLFRYANPLLRIGSFGTLLLFSTMSMAVGSYNPFIYFRF